MSIHLKNIHELLQVRKYFKDLSKEYLHCKKVEKEPKITDIMAMYNKHCVCDVRCPFGCTDFRYKCGTIPFYLVLRKFVNSKHIAMFDKWHRNNNNVVETLNRFIKSPRRDFLTYSDKILEEFEISLTIIVKDNEGLVILTCRNHHQGYNKNMMHPPYMPVNKHLPTPRSDQLPHAVSVPRNVKPFRDRHYNNRFQMTEMKGNYKGFDTAYLVECDNFYYNSDMMYNSDCLCIAFREDIKAKW